MSDRDPRILPGISAKAREQTLSALVWGWTGLLPISAVAACLSGAFHWPFHGFGFEFGAATGLIVVMLAASFFTIVDSGLRSQRRAHAEVAAGYTTLLNRYDQVDGIDARTGLVVRPALPHRMPGSIDESIGSGAELGSVDTERVPLGVAMRTPWAAVGSVASIAATVVGSVGISFDPDNASGWLWALAFAGLLGVIVFPSFGLSYAPTTFYVRSLQSEYPNAKVLVGRPSYNDVVGELLPLGAARLDGARDRLSGYLVFEKDRVIFYSRSHTRLVPFLEIPRSRIHSAHIGSVYNNSSGLATTATVLSVTKDDGSSLDVTLGFGPSRISSPMRIAIEMDDSAIWVRNWISAS